MEAAHLDFMKKLHTDVAHVVLYLKMTSMEVVHLHAIENVSLVHLSRMVRIGARVFQNDQNVQNLPKFSKMVILIIDGWSGLE